MLIWCLKKNKDFIVTFSVNGSVCWSTQNDYTSAGGVDEVFGEVLVNRTNVQGCQFDVHFSQCQTSTDISGIVNQFVQMSRTISNMYTYPFDR